MTTRGLPPLFGFPWEQKPEKGNGHSRVGEEGVIQVFGAWVWRVPRAHITPKLGFAPGIKTIPHQEWELVRMRPGRFTDPEEAHDMLKELEPGLYVLAIGLGGGMMRYQIIEMEA